MTFMNCWHSIIQYYKKKEVEDESELKSQTISSKNNYSKSKKKVSSSGRMKLTEEKINDLQQCTEENC